MSERANIGARLDRLPNSGWHIKMWLVSAFALLVCWSNGIGGAVQNILLNELHWLEPGTKLLAMWGTTYTAGQLFGALVGGPIGDKIGRKKSILLYEVIHIIAMIGGAVSPNITIFMCSGWFRALALALCLSYCSQRLQSMFRARTEVCGLPETLSSETSRTRSATVSHWLLFPQA